MPVGEQDRDDRRAPGQKQTECEDRLPGRLPPDQRHQVLAVGARPEPDDQTAGQSADRVRDDVGDGGVAVTDEELCELDQGAQQAGEQHRTQDGPQSFP